MPSRRKAIEEFWQWQWQWQWQWPCLLPVRLPQKGLHNYLQPAARNLFACRNLQQRHTHTPNSPTRPQVNPPSLRRPVNSQAQQYVIWKPSLVGQHVRDRARTRELEITSAYQNLRWSIVKSNYTHIRDSVEILVKERGQKPNLRLYDALLLANTDNEYGSAGEVAQILDEVSVEGLTPDSATYHAALRVGERAKGILYALAYIK